MSKTKEVTANAIDKTPNCGRPVTKGDTPGSKYNSWLEAQGLDKATILERMTSAETAGQMVAEIEKKMIGLQMFGVINDATSEYYNNNKNRDLALNRQLQEIDVDIKMHKIDKLKEDPTYSPIDDKQLLKWVALRADLMDKIRKAQMELTKMATDKDSVVADKDVDWDAI